MSDGMSGGKSAGASNGMSAGMSGAHGPGSESRATADSRHDPAALAELLGIWGEVLGLPEIDPEAGFLAQGGASVTAMRVVNRVRARFGVRLPLTLLLSGSTARDIAAHIDSETTGNEVSRP